MRVEEVEVALVVVSSSSACLKLGQQAQNSSVKLSDALLALRLVCGTSESHRSWDVFGDVLGGAASCEWRGIASFERCQ